MPHILGPVGNAARGKSAAARSRIIARAHAQAWEAKRQTPGANAAWVVGNLTVNIASVVAIDIDLIVVVDVAGPDAQPRPFANPLIIRNPRLLVPTDQTEIVIDEDGQPQTVTVFREDLEAALQIMVSHQVLLQCRP